VTTLAGGEAVIVGLGLVTAVGATVKETAASVRSSTARFTETAIRDKSFQPVTLAVVPDDVLPALTESVDKTSGLTSRMRRMIRLVAPVLAEATSSLPSHAPRPGLVLAMPEIETRIPLDGDRFLAALARQDFHFDAAYGSVTQVGRAGGLMAVAQAAELVGSGRVPLMLAGGVDTFRDPYVVATLDMEGRLKSSANSDGFIPGEGAALVLVANRRRAADYGLVPLGVISHTSLGIEPGHLYSSEIYRGDGLASTLTELLMQARLALPIQEVFSSMNGESHWAKEWSVAFLRNRSAFVDNHGMHHPADCYGDLGAAAGPAMVSLAITGFGGGVRRSPALVYASSDRGPRAAMLVTSSR
jgi:3-oxoacyl-[acyl-carrier-protein] synthase-1